MHSDPEQQHVHSARATQQRHRAFVSYTCTLSLARPAEAEEDNDHAHVNALHAAIPGERAFHAFSYGKITTDLECM